METRKQRIAFIINPISGGINKEGLPGIIRDNLDMSRYQPEIMVTTDEKDTITKALDAVERDFDVLVAAGGDGTIHQVANKLIGKRTALGIIPAGSGNGFARHLNIPLKPIEAVKFINTAHIRAIDTINCNGEHYVNVAGVGFDAHIGYLFAHAPERGFKTYAKITLRELWNYKPEEYELEIDGMIVKEKAFLVSFANGSQWGNNAVIAPKAELNDGLVDVCVLKKFKAWDMPGLGIKIMLTGNIDKSPLVDVYKAKKVTLRRSSSGALHMDGEPYEMGDEINIQVKPASLNILAYPHEQ